MTFEDFNEITRRRYEYAFGVDRRDWDLYRSVFTDEIEMDFSSYSGAPAAKMPAKDWVAAVKPVFTGLNATQHAMTNPMVDVTGETAQCTMYVQAAHFLDEDAGMREFTLGGYYVDRLVKQKGRWRINAVTLTVLWNRGDRAIMARAAERGAEMLKA